MRVVGRNLSLLLTLTSLLVTLSACAPKVPIPVLEYRSMPTVQQPNLLVLLRGRGGSYLDFERYGIIEAVREHNLPFDIVVPDAHFGYYLTETLHERLKFDIIDPARDQGYQQIWLAGFSMGGIGALFYPISYPDEPVAGLLLSSPFLGDGVV
ncbi:MAG: hypothetical protein C0614_05585, partial [Desulfuromonas sp.]